MFGLSVASRRTARMRMGGQLTRTAQGGAGAPMAVAAAAAVAPRAPVKRMMEMKPKAVAMASAASANEDNKDSAASGPRKRMLNRVREIQDIVDDGEGNVGQAEKDLKKVNMLLRKMRADILAMEAAASDDETEDVADAVPMMKLVVEEKKAPVAVQEKKAEPKKKSMNRSFGLTAQNHGQKGAAKAQGGFSMRKSVAGSGKSEKAEQFKNAFAVRKSLKNEKPAQASGAKKSHRRGFTVDKKDEKTDSHSKGGSLKMRPIVSEKSDGVKPSGFSGLRRIF